jgi:hypothetical protein
MDIEGIWYNELNSILTIEPVASGGFSGTYQTGVSSSGCATGSFRVVGRTDTDSGGDAVAFVVCWVNETSQCALGDRLVRAGANRKRTGADRSLLASDSRIGPGARLVCNACRARPFLENYAY